MNKLLVLALIPLALVGCASQPASVVVPQPPAAPTENDSHQVCITVGNDAYCVRSELTPSGSHKYELITK